MDSRIRGAALALLLAATAALTGCSSSPAEPPGPSAPAPSTPAPSAAAAAAAADSRAYLKVDGAKRDYLLHRPGKSAEAGHARKPLVIAFHGRTHRAEDMRKLSALNKAADRHGLLVAYPQGLNNGWGDGTAPSARRPDPDTDVRFAEALVKKLIRSEHADPKRVYVVGFSNGGSMALRMAAQRPRLVTAVATVAGQLPTKAAAVRPTGPVRALLIYGDKDPVRPITGMPNPAPPTGGSEPPTPTMSARASAEAFAAVGGAGSPATEKEKGYTRTVWAAPPADAEVQLLVVHGGGHSWPGSAWSPSASFGPTSKALDATGTMVGFLTGTRS